MMGGKSKGAAKPVFHDVTHDPKQKEEIQKVADAAVKQENVKRNNEGEPTFSLLNIISAEYKKHEGGKYKLVLQVAATEKVSTYNVHIWHKMDHSMFGGVTKQSYVLTSFVDSDHAWLKSFDDSGQKKYTYKHELSIDNEKKQKEADKGKHTQVCNCPPALSTWDCDEKEYRAIMNGQLCAFYRANPQDNAGDGDGDGDE